MATTHTLSVLVENKPGVLARVAGLFSRRGFNIDSLAVGPTEHPEVSRMTIVVSVEDLPLEQVTKQLNKLINVIKIVELDRTLSVQRELLLVKVRADDTTRRARARDGRAVPGQGRRRRPRTPSPSRPPAPRTSSTRCCGCSSRTASARWCSPAWWPSAAGHVR